MPRDFEWNDMQRFIDDQFKPFMGQMAAHIEKDDKRFDEMNRAMNRISSSIEIQTATGAALAKQAVIMNEHVAKLKENKLAKISMYAFIASPIVAICALALGVYEVVKNIGLVH